MKSSQSGFTLIELMLSVAIVGIMASMAVPTFSKMIEQNQLTSVTEQMYQNILFAQSEAIRNNQDVFLDFSGDNTTSWGFKICKSSPCEASPIKAFNANSESDNVTIDYDSGLDGAKFDPSRGFIDNPGTIILSLDATRKKTITINKLGRPKIE